MRFFEQLVHDGKSECFYQVPMEFNKTTDKSILRYCIGAALYMPATRKMISQEIIAHKYPACTTIVLDLEDALGDLQVVEGEENLLHMLSDLASARASEQLHIDAMPLLFVRVRSPQQLEKMIEQLGPYQQMLTGYVLPKFSTKDGAHYLEQIKKQNELGYTLYAMPILESQAILNKESRLAELLAIRTLLEQFEAIVLNVRIGSTDFCGALGIRRSIQHTVYDLATVQDCLADIMNVFLRDESPFVLSGSVWEFFGTDDAVAGLLREITFDTLNGLIGKTVIHPSHIEVVQAKYVVSHEEYCDAAHIIEQSHGEIGVEKSSYGNKMNEMKPHFVWAKRMLLRAQAYGVLKPGVSYEQLFTKQVGV
ncbi:HpcH/HpaI aldolase/citrate lyase family protein [Solibacillus sp.]|uniref:HpcH/HpaI aldolase/citrate lyase family protein n=1 Tax=Solibacillus sp. TaxID=1909654 RepID=UPI003315821D